MQYLQHIASSESNKSKNDGDDNAACSQNKSLIIKKSTEVRIVKNPDLKKLAEWRTESDVIKIEEFCDVFAIEYRVALRHLENREFRAAAYTLVRLTYDPRSYLEIHIHCIRAFLHIGEFTIARQVAARADEIFPDNMHVVLASADIAQRLRETDRCIELCVKLRTLSPGNIDSYIVQIRALRDAERYSEIYDIANTISDYCESHLGITLELLFVYYHSNDTDKVEKYSRVMQKHFPDVAEGYMLWARSLLREGKFIEADNIISTAPNRVSSSSEALSVRFFAALGRGQSAAALNFAQQSVDNFTNDVSAHELMAIALRGIGDSALWGEFVSKNLQRFPTSARLAIEHAMVAESQNDFGAALARWREVRERFPDIPDGYANEARVLMREGAFEKAEALIAVGYRRFPRDVGILRFYGLSATRRRDWTEAFSRWKAALAIYPDNREFLDGMGETELAYSYAQVDGAVALTTTGTHPLRRPPSRQSDAPNIDKKQFYLGFESIGSNCEFGLVQRSFGAEPLGLLRWATIYPINLIRLLANNFQGIGEIENTFVVEGEHGEYGTGDSRYFNMHTFVATHSVSKEKLLLQMAKRLVFLSSKLCEDLKEGSKIFVYKSADDIFELKMAQELHRTMQTYGKNNLFCVMKPPPGKEDASIEKMEEGLFFGYIQDLTRDPQNVHKYLDKWDFICRKVRCLVPLT